MAEILIPDSLAQELKDKIMAYKIPLVMHGKIVKIGPNSFHLIVLNGDEFRPFINILRVNKNYRDEALKIFADKVTLRIDMAGNEDLSKTSSLALRAGNRKPGIGSIAEFDFLVHDSSDATFPTIPIYILEKIQHFEFAELDAVEMITRGEFNGRRDAFRKFLISRTSKDVSKKYLRRVTGVLQKTEEGLKMISHYTEAFSASYMPDDVTAVRETKEKELHYHQRAIEECLEDLNSKSLDLQDKLGLLQEAICRRGIHACGPGLMPYYMDDSPPLVSFSYIDHVKVECGAVLLPRQYAIDLYEIIRGRGEWMNEEDFPSQDKADQEDQPKKLPHIPKEIWDMIIDAATPSMMKGKIIKTGNDTYKLDVYNGEDFKAFVSLLPVSKDTRKEALSVLSKKTVLSVGISDEHDLNAGAIKDLKPVAQDILNNITRASLWEFSTLSVISISALAFLGYPLFIHLPQPHIRAFMGEEMHKSNYLRRTAVELRLKNTEWYIDRNYTRTSSKSCVPQDSAEWLRARDQELLDQRTAMDTSLQQSNASQAGMEKMLGRLQKEGLKGERQYHSNVTKGELVVFCCRENVTAVLDMIDGCSWVDEESHLTSRKEALDKET